MTFERYKLTAAICASTFMTSAGLSAPIEKQKPRKVVPAQSIAPGMQLRFVKLQGVNQKTGVFSRKGTITEYRPKVVHATRSVLVMGVVKPVKYKYTVQQRISRTIGTQTHDMYYGNGKLVPAEELFEEIKDGQIVLISSTPRIPRAFLNLLSPDAVIIVPKPEAPKRKATRP